MPVYSGLSNLFSESCQCGLNSEETLAPKYNCLKEKWESEHYRHKGENCYFKKDL